MPIGIIATLTIAEGKNDEFEAIFTRLAEKVNAEEDGCNFYALHQSNEDPQTYKVLEQYRDQEALDAHGKTDYFRALGKEMGGCMAGAPQLEMLRAV